MKIDRYVVLPSEGEALALIQQIDQARAADHWAEPNINPFDGRALVPWHDEYLAKQSHLIKGMKSIAFDDAQNQGWAFGYFKGRFAKARIKLEETQTIRVGLNAFDQRPNYPAYRALFFGLLSSLYGVKEAVRQACVKIEGDANDWWELRFQEIMSDPLLHLLYKLNNADKHSISSPLLRPRQNLYGYRGTYRPGMVVSAEGVFAPINVGTSRERREFFYEAEAIFDPYLDTINLEHKGQEVSGLGLKAQLDMAISHYEDLVFEARRLFE